MTPLQALPAHASRDVSYDPNIGLLALFEAAAHEPDAVLRNPNLRLLLLSHRPASLHLDSIWDPANVEQGLTRLLPHIGRPLLPFVFMLGDPTRPLHAALDHSLIGSGDLPPLLSNMERSLPLEGPPHERWVSAVERLACLPGVDETTFLRLMDLAGVDPGVGPQLDLDDELAHLFHRLATQEMTPREVVSHPIMWITAVSHPGKLLDAKTAMSYRYVLVALHHLAASVATPDLILRLLVRHPIPSVRLFLAQNPRTPASALRQLAEQHAQGRFASEMRGNLIGRADLPRDVRSLLEDTDEA